MMKKDTKDERISFRITPELDSTINEIVDKYDEIKDRSDLGMKALKLYMTFLNQENEIWQSMKKALMALSERMDLEDNPDIKKLREFIERYDS